MKRSPALWVLLLSVVGCMEEKKPSNPLAWDAGGPECQELKDSVRRFNASDRHDDAVMAARRYKIHCGELGYTVSVPVRATPQVP